MSRSPASDSPRRVIIVGASAAGLRCAARLKRLEPSWQIRVIEAREVFSYGACGMPYVLSGDIEDVTQLRQTSYGTVRDEQFFRDCKGVRILSGHRVIAADSQRRTVTIKSARGISSLEWDDLILATGGRARRLPGQGDDPRIRAFHELEDLPPLKKGLIAGKISRVVIVGAGLVGCELAEAFRSMWGAEVAMVEAADRPLPGMLGPATASIAAHQLQEAGVELSLGSPVDRFLVEPDSVGVLAGGKQIRGDLVLVAVGVEPNTELAVELGVELGVGGCIRVDDKLATSISGVWAAGDCVTSRQIIGNREIHLPLGSLANRQGRVLADVLAGRKSRFPAVAGAMAVKLFNWNAAAAGLGEEAARAAGFDPATAWITTEQAAHYWPESHNIYLQLLYDRVSRKILGVQAIGQGNACHPVNLAAQQMQHGAFIDDLAQIEHAYAPPFAPALDPLAVAAFAAENQLDGVVAKPPVAESLTGSLIDLRLERERNRRPLHAASVRQIDLPTARKSWNGEYPGECVVVCEHGTRSAEVARSAGGEASDVYYLGGGLSWLRAAGLAGDFALGGQQ